MSHHPDFFNPLTRVVFAARVIRYACNNNRDALRPIICAHVTSSWYDTIRNFEFGTVCWKSPFASRSSSDEIAETTNSAATTTAASSSSASSASCSSTAHRASLSVHAVSSVQRLLPRAASSDATLWVLKQLVAAGCVLERQTGTAAPHQARTNRGDTTALHASVAHGERSRKCLEFIARNCYVDDSTGACLIFDAEDEWGQRQKQKGSHVENQPVRRKAMHTTAGTLAGSTLRRVDPDVEFGVSEPRTALIEACEKHDVVAVKILVEELGANINYVIKRGSGSLHSAPNQLAVLHFAVGPFQSLSAVTTSNSTSSRNKRPIDNVRARYEVVKYLLELNTKKDEKSGNQEAPKSGINIALAPARADADAPAANSSVRIDALDSNDYSPLMRACSFAHLEESVLMKEQERQRHSDHKQQPHEEEEPVDTVVELLIRHGANVQLFSTDRSGRISALHVAASVGAPRALRALIRRARELYHIPVAGDTSSPPNQDDCEDTATPQQQQLKPVLRKSEYDQYRKKFLDSRTMTTCRMAVHFTAAKNHVEATAILVKEEGANIRQPDAEGNLPLHLSLNEANPLGGENARYEVCRMLLENGSVVSLENGEGRTPMKIFESRVKELNEYSNGIDDVPEVRRLRQLLMKYGVQ